MLPLRYALTDDGVQIAYGVRGTGPPLVVMPTIPFSHFRLEAEQPEYARVLDGLAGYTTLIQYDARGTGSSDPHPADFSVDAMSRDLRAVISSIGVTRPALFALYSASLCGIAFAATEGAVSALILWAPVVRGGPAMGGAQSKALLSLLDQDWELFTETAAHAWMGWPVGDSSRRVAKLFREAVSQENARVWLATTAGTDVHSLLPQVRVPTLILHRSGMPTDTTEAREIAALIPDAQLEIFPDEAANFYAGDSAAVIRSIAAFLGSRVAAPLADRASGLSPREIEVLRLLALGETNEGIGHRLGISVNTVERHVVNVYSKIGARGRADAAAYAVRRGLA